jgi:hypothetical protein
LPSVDALYKAYRSRGLEVRFIAFREELDLLRRTAAERGYTAPVLLDASGDTTGRVYGVWGPPTVYVLDRQGRLAGRGIGPVPWESPAMRALLESLLAQAPSR